MKYCIAIGKTTSPTTPLLLDGDFAVSMQTAASLGYNAVEIHTPDPETLDTAALRTVCEKLGIFIATIGTGQIYGRYGLYLMDPNEARRRQLVGMLRRYIDIAEKLGSKVTIGSIKGNVPKDADRAYCLGVMGEMLREITSYAAEKGVTVLLEATNRFENNVLNTGREVRSMIEDNALRNCQVLMDTFHINIEERSLSTCLRDAGPWLGHIHFGDNTRMYPGSGSFNYDAFCRSIREIGYDGVLSVECFPLPDGLTAATQTIRFFQHYFG
ncbi:MAG: sugar phosphate isomerase/epimerase family protein [Oscillospiraceae bacterium]|nr:sugar phosphate isomerase/epimerase family protein [Oscillospiraceae bacterium]